MRIRILLLVLASSLTAFAQAPFSIGWLRKGLERCVIMDKQGGEPKFDQAEQASAVYCSLYFKGFLAATDEWSGQSGGKIRKMPEEWEIGFKPHESFVSYLAEFEKTYKFVIPEDMDAQLFVAVWYSVKHPDVSPELYEDITKMFYVMHFAEKRIDNKEK